MADVTGPISTLPNSVHSPPEGAKCDEHPNLPAMYRVQGETDSFGSEMHDLCGECFRRWRAEPKFKPDACDWCKEPADDCAPTRDYDEGMYGPVYYVCRECRRRQNDEARAELARYDLDSDWD